MAREIKFRAWDKKFKVMYQWEDLESLDLVKKTFINSINPITEGCEENLNDLVLTQYTGLKDKNGVEIYDGDLIKKDYHDNQIYKVVFCSQGHFAGAFCLQNVFDKKFTSFSQESIWMPGDNPSNFDEVLGNIYEDHELLAASEA